MSPNLDFTFLAAKEVDTRRTRITNNIYFTHFMMDLLDKRGEHPLHPQDTKKPF
jgi:hypothetical protein